MKIQPSMLVLILSPLATSAVAYAGHNLASTAKLTIEQARATALKARPGTISAEELEREKGGSGLRYAFDVKRNKAVYEVEIDAVTGAVLENSKEGRHPELMNGRIVCG